MIISPYSRLGSVLTSSQYARASQVMVEADQALDAVYGGIIEYSATADPADFFVVYESLRRELEAGTARLTSDDGFASGDEALAYFTAVRDAARVLNEDVLLGLEVAPLVRDGERRAVPQRSQLRWIVALSLGIGVFGVFVVAAHSAQRRRRRRRKG